jgi:predicted alpha/beta-fold hydrolase
MIPFGIFSDPRVTGNANLQVLPVPHGGHLGFIADSAPHFWVDRVVLDWIQSH